MSRQSLRNTFTGGNSHSQGSSQMYPPLPNMVSNLNPDAACFTMPRQPNTRGNHSQNHHYSTSTHNPTPPVPMTLQTTNYQYAQQQQHSHSQPLTGGNKPLPTFPVPKSYNAPPARLPQARARVTDESKEDQGRITTDEGLGTSNTLAESNTTTSGSTGKPDDRAPPFECLQNYVVHLAAKEHREVLQMQMKALFEKVNAELTDIHPDRGVGLIHESVGLLFHICHRFQTSDDVKYLACEIYDRYIIKSTAAMLIEMRNCEDEGQIKDIQNRLASQALLRMGSCIQLASKVSAPGGFGKFITSTQLKRLLQSFNQNYSLNAINKSETRTVQHLDWKLCDVTTLHIIEILLIQLDGIEPAIYRKVYAVATHILDFVYLNREVVYEQLFQEISANYNVTKEKFRAMIQFSKIIEGVFVLGTALLSEYTINDPVFEKLGNISQVNCGDVPYFAKVVLSRAANELQCEKENQQAMAATNKPPVRMSSSASVSIIT